MCRSLKTIVFWGQYRVVSVAGRCCLDSARRVVLIAFGIFLLGNPVFAWENQQDEKSLEPSLPGQRLFFLEQDVPGGLLSVGGPDSNAVYHTPHDLPLFIAMKNPATTGERETHQMTYTPSFTASSTWDNTSVLPGDFARNPQEPFAFGDYRRSGGEWGLIRSDFRNFYSRDTMANILVGYGVHAILSNTAMDQNLTDWYQDNVRSVGSDRFSRSVRDMGTEKMILPVLAVATIYYCDRIWQKRASPGNGSVRFDQPVFPSERTETRVRFFERPVGSFLGEFASRTTRAYLVGTPTMLFSQVLIGAGRPNYPLPTSRWQPFVYDKGVSGHAFVGAMPFITLAQMSDNFWWKTGFYLCSALTPWSRFNDDAHYFSQVMLGWYLAYLSCRAVSKTEYHILPRGMTVFPIWDLQRAESRTVGVGLAYQW